MRKYEKNRLSQEAQKLGFIRDTYEKVCRLSSVLSFRIIGVRPTHLTLLEDADLPLLLLSHFLLFQLLLRFRDIGRVWGDAVFLHGLVPGFVVAHPGDYLL